MRRIAATPHSRAYCLSKAVEQEWLAENAPSPAGAALCFDAARYWRSLALVAPPDAPPLKAD